MLAIADLTLTYPDWQARYNLAVPAGRICALIGPSGGGKTTLLHAIAGFTQPSSGTLSFDGRDLLPLTPAERPLSILFQDHNLFPHLTAAQNAGLGIRPNLRLRDGDTAAVAAALDRVGLAGLGDRRPDQLSGGQRQRVALARAILRNRPLLLLDEPFSALDPGLRREMIALVNDIRRQQGTTILMSIHTPEEAADAADLMALVTKGKVAAVGAPAEMLRAGTNAELDRYFGRRPGGQPPIL